MSSSSCLICPRGPGPSESLDRHYRRHLLYWAWSCGECGVAFPALEDGEAHALVAHAGRRPRLQEARDPDMEHRLQQLLQESLGPSSSLHEPSEPEEAEPKSSRRRRREPSPAPAAFDSTVGDMDGDAADTKPAAFIVAKDAGLGKLECGRCSRAVPKNAVRDHAIQAHLGLRAFVCALCPQREAKKPLMKKHIAREHPEANGDEFSDLSSTMERKIKAEVERCFGDVDVVEARKLECTGCGARVSNCGIRDHIAKHHLKETVYECRRCEWTSMAWYSGSAKAHAAKAHSAPFDDATIASQQDRLRNMVNALCEELFPATQPA